MSNKMKWLKKLLAILLITSLLFGSLTYMPVIIPGSVPSVSAVKSTETEIPDGYTAIYTIDDLYSIRANSSGNYILMNDIDLSASAPGGDWDCGTGWSPIPEFKGTLNGNSHIIKNLHFYGNTDCIGFIKKLYGIVHDLKFTNVDVDITGAEVFGTICSYICCEQYSNGYGSSFRAGEISKCGVDGTIHVEGPSSYIGGLVGKLQNPDGPIDQCKRSPGRIDSSYNAADIESVSVDCCVGGIVGYEGYNYTWSSSQNIAGGSTTYSNHCGVIENCYNSGNIVGQSNNAGGIVGNQNGDIINCICFTDGAIYGSKGKGCNANARYQPTTDNCYCRNNCTFGQGGTELSPFFMKKVASFNGFDFDNVWEMAPDRSHPQLRHPREITAVSMEISQMPSQTVYHVGDEFEASGQITVQCSNGNTAVVDITEDMLSGYDMDTVETQTVTVSYYDLTTSYEIIVKDIEPTDITLNESDITLEVGDIYTELSATVYPSNVPDKTVTWTASDSSVATVSNGKITAVAPGTSTITATTVNGKTATCTVTVSIPVSGIGLNKTETTINQGDTETLSATITPSNATNKSVTWTTSDSSVATVSNGKITAVAPGTATITATTVNGKTATCTVTVSIPVSGIGLNKTETTINQGDTETLSATITPSNATNKSVTWTTSDSSVATVSNGKITTVAPGTATITATTVNGKTATCTVTVIIPVSGIGLNKTETTINQGDTETLSATITPSNATNKSVTWTTSDSSVATVSNGKITAVAPGTATITATTVNGETDSCMVTVIISPTEYTVSNMLSNVKTSNSITKIMEGESYTETLSPESGYEIKSVTAAMAGVAVNAEKSGDNYVINIPSVKGNITVTAIAAKIETPTHPETTKPEVTTGTEPTEPTTKPTEPTEPVTQPYYPNVKAEIKAESIKTRAESTVEVPISISNNPGLVGMTLNIEFDSSVLKLTNVKDGGILGTKYHKPEYKSPYKLSWANDTDETDITENGTIATLTFEVPKDTPIGKYPIIITYEHDNYGIYNKDLKLVKFNITDGAVEVTKSICGDVNGDGKVNNLDRVYLTRHLADWEEYKNIDKQAADVNNDGKVNNLDRVILTRYLAGWEAYQELPYKS